MEWKWHCSECETLLGVERGVRLHLRYKQAQYIVGGSDYNVTAVCRNCSTVNERIETADSSKSAAAHA